MVAFQRSEQNTSPKMLLTAMVGILCLARDARAQPSVELSKTVETQDTSRSEGSLWELEEGIEQRPRGGIVTGATAEFWLPLAISRSESQTPPYLLGAGVTLGISRRVTETLELQPTLASSFLASKRGVLFPTGAHLQVVFTPFPGIFSALSLGGGWLIGSLTPHLHEWELQRNATFVQGYMTPFGFRFGADHRGELGLRFGGIFTKIIENDQTRWALALVTTGTWLTYLF